MTRYAWLLLALVATGAYATPLAQVLEFGYYEVQSEGDRYRDPDAPSGIVQAGPTVKLLAATNVIPLKKGRHFGFRFRIGGVTERDAIEVRMVVTHPPMYKPDRGVSKGYETKLGLNVRLGEVIDYAGYSFDQDYELVEGDWKFEFYHGNTKLLEQKFVTTSSLTETAPAPATTISPAPQPKAVSPQPAWPANKKATAPPPAPARAP
jgi:hypothetical protein